jgi:hypothetical protein
MLEFSYLRYKPKLQKKEIKRTPQSLFNHMGKSSPPTPKMEACVKAMI